MTTATYTPPTVYDRRPYAAPVGAIEQAVTVAPRPQADKTIKIEIDPDKLTLGAILELSEGADLASFVRWLSKYCEMPEESVRAIPLSQLGAVRTQISAAIEQAVPKANG